MDTIDRSKFTVDLTPNLISGCRRDKIVEILSDTTFDDVKDNEDNKFYIKKPRISCLAKYYKPKYTTISKNTTCAAIRSIFFSDSEKNKDLVSKRDICCKDCHIAAALDEELKLIKNT